MWKDFEYNGLKYSVDEYGNILGYGRNKIIKQGTNKDGYCVVTLGAQNNRKRIKVHKIVATMFVSGYKDGYEVNHKDFNRKNNYYKNLEWVTHRENVDKSVSAGRYYGRIGEKNGMCKIKENQVEEIREKYKCGHTIASLSREYGIGYTQTSRIAKYESWKHIL